MPADQGRPSATPTVPRCSLLLHCADQTEAYNGHTIPQFPEKGEDVNLAGVRACLHLPGSCGGLGAEQHRALEHQRIPAALRLLLPLETEGARLISRF